MKVLLNLQSIFQNPNDYYLQYPIWKKGVNAFVNPVLECGIL